VKRPVSFSAGVLALAVLVAGCGGAKKSSKPAAGNTGGTFIAVANAAPSGSPDPQVNYTLQEWQLLIFTHDGLVAFKRAGGREGTKLVPDLAESIPKPTNGGKTWTFKLRSGIKFSNGQTVTPKDVRATFERLFKIGDSPNSGTWYNVIVGGDACVKKPKSCSLAKGITTSGNKITFHLTHGDPEFLDKLGTPFAFILPTGTSNKEVQIPPPGTGPYYFAQYNPNKQIKLVRNKYFKEWSKDAQPAGNPDVILQKFGLGVEAEVTQVENGQADWVFDTPPADRLNELSSKYSKQVFINPLTAVWYIALNTRIPPFNNLKARQAVMAALSQEDYMRALVGDDNALWKALPGFFTPDTPLYTEEGGEILKGKRDLTAAKKLLAESSYKGEPVTCVVAQDQPITKAQGDVTAELLKRIGMNVDFVATDWGTTGQRRAQKSPPGQGGWGMFHTWHAGADCVNPAVYIAIRATGDTAWFGWPNVPSVETEVTAWFDAKTLDEEKAAIKRLNKAALDNVVYAPTGFFLGYQAWRKNVSGIVKGPIPFAWGVSKTA
jgi:peptide/nickel transport system substrate-binding protein